MGTINPAYLETWDFMTYEFLKLVRNKPKWRKKLELKGFVTGIIGLEMGSDYCLKYFMK